MKNIQKKTTEAFISAAEAALIFLIVSYPQYTEITTVGNVAESLINMPVTKLSSFIMISFAAGAIYAAATAAFIYIRNHKSL